MDKHNVTEVITVNAQTAAAKIGVAATGATYSFLTLDKMVALATLIFVLLQIGLLVPKYTQMYKAWKKNRKVEVRMK